MILVLTVDMWIMIKRCIKLWAIFQGHSVNKLYSIHSCSHWYKNRKNHPTNDRATVGNKVARFYGTRCISNLLITCSIKKQKWRHASSSGDATPGRQMTWLEDPPPWLRPWLRPGSRPGSALPIALLCFGNSVNRKYQFYHIGLLTALFVLFWQWNNLSGVGGFCVWGRRLKNKKVVNFFEEKSAADLARGCSNLEMTWLLCCAGAATGIQKHSRYEMHGSTSKIQLASS